MHRLPKIFSYNSDRRKNRSESDSGSMDGSNRRAAKLKPKLDRLNAKKNINYDFSPSTSSSSSFFSSYEESIRHRSMEFYGGRTHSFRINGDEGEIQILREAMGFSGDEDFGIPLADYEAMKMRSSSAPVCLSDPVETSFDGFNYENVDVSSSRDWNIVGRNSSDLISTRCPETHDLAYPSYDHVNSSRINVYSSSVDDVTVRNSVLSDNVCERSKEFRGNGIKGLRPPLLSPPPLMSVPVIDEGCSAWDIVRSFAPESDTRFARLDMGVSLDDDDEGIDRQRMVSGREDNYPLSESYSFTASSNDDSSSSTTPLSSISPNGIFGRVIENWQKGDLLGRGTFGSVYEGIAANGFFFAVKEVSLLEQEDGGRKSILQLEQEISLLSQFEHENIVKYYGTKKDESRLYIFLELVKGSLLSLYRRYDLVDSVVSAYTRQILLGLKYLHDKGVVHRDIKCANILVHSNGLVKLADFGLAKVTKLNDARSCVGTPFWMAPEVVRNVGYGLPADIWSLGCTVLEMLTRSFPYSNFEPGAAIFRIGQGRLPDIPNNLSSDAHDFILKCLKVEPSFRPTAEQLLEHPFVKRSLQPSPSSPSPRHFHRHS